jgi:hypothetical protein
MADGEVGSAERLAERDLAVGGDDPGGDADA